MGCNETGRHAAQRECEQKSTRLLLEGMARPRCVQAGDGHPCRAQWKHQALPGVSAGNTHLLAGLHCISSAAPVAQKSLFIFKSASDFTHLNFVQLLDLSLACVVPVDPNRRWEEMFDILRYFCRKLGKFFQVSPLTQRELFGRNTAVLRRNYGQMQPLMPYYCIHIQCKR